MRNRHLWPWIDSIVWIAAVFLAVTLRYDFRLNYTFSPKVLIFAVGVAAVHIAAGYLLGPYKTRHFRGSFEEILDLGRCVGAVTLIAQAFTLAGQALVPRSVPLVAGIVALAGMFAIRLSVRTFRARVTGDNANVPRVLVYGAGEEGKQFIRALARDGERPYVAAALLDDDPSRQRLVIDGVHVRGTLEDLDKLAVEYSASALVVAIRDLNPEMMRTLEARARDVHMKVLVLPPTKDLFNDTAKATDLRSLDLSDLLGRRPIELDRQAIAASVSGRKILVTGAGGSIGSELCRQLASFEPAALLLLDRDESALHGTQLTLSGHGLLSGEDTILADIRDEARVLAIFEEHRPDIVFHAAALKHLPLLERYPEEAWKTNVLGTRNVLHAAHKVGVSIFVNISTDKAAHPSSILGYSKRLTERLTSSYAKYDDGTYVSVRFGNVLGSRGSVVTSFTAQIERGGPVTVTDPDVERYFMLIPEACQLVLQAASIGKDGEVMVLDMGQPAKIVDVARHLINLSGKTNVEIVFTGLRPGEKMTEELFDPDESIKPTAHPLVSHVPVPPLTGDVVLRPDYQDPEKARSVMIELALPRSVESN